MTKDGVEHLMNQNYSYPVVLKILDKEIRKRMVIIFASDQGEKVIECWAKDKKVVELIKNSKVGSLIKITDWN